MCIRIHVKIVPLIILALIGNDALAPATQSISLITPINYAQLTSKIDIDSVTLPDSAPIKTLFAHGHLSNHRSGIRYTSTGPDSIDFIPDADSGKSGSIAVFDFPNSSAFGRFNAFSNACFGQNDDIACLAREYTYWVSKGYRVILAGVSRGAATIINFMATHTTKNVIAVWAQSPFAHVDDVINSVIRRNPELASPKSARFIVQKMHPKYKPDGIQPINVAHNIQHDVPVLLVCSKQDGIIPASSTVKVYQKIVDSNHKKAHILITETGSHARIAWSRSGEELRTTYHGFLRYYNAPHYAHYAQACLHPDFIDSFRMPVKKTVGSMPGARKTRKSLRHLAR